MQSCYYKFTGYVTQIWAHVTLVATIRQSLKAPTLSPDSNILDRNYTCESELKNIRILAWNRMLDTLSHCHLNSEDLKGKRTKQQ